MKPKEFLNQLRRDELSAAIREAESKTSGEIRLVVHAGRVEDPVAAATREFDKLGMSRTRERNGVLILVAPQSQNFAVIGDEAVHARCGDAFWTRMAEEMTEHFRRSDFHAGLLHAIHKAGELLAEHFPHRPDDRNELSDDIVSRPG